MWWCGLSRGVVYHCMVWRRAFGIEGRAAFLVGFRSIYPSPQLCTANITLHCLYFRFLLDVSYFSPRCIADPPFTPSSCSTSTLSRERSDGVLMGLMGSVPKGEFAFGAVGRVLTMSSFPRGHPSPRRPRRGVHALRLPHGQRRARCRRP
ncbi:hypothetical protein B0H12DRAFT_82728 [Mycena haematopus]|nr:hypothetical protein B0H12DRAFT_82728 [Mycena haematopus]